MANKRHYPRKGQTPFIGLPVLSELSLSTLGDNQVIKDALTSLAQDFYAISADLTWAIHGFTPTEGPLQFGLAHGDYTVTEIKEAIEAAPISQSDKIAIERSRRQVRKVGLFQGQVANESFNDGRVKRVRTKMMLTEGQELAAWVYNTGGSALTTGSQVDVMGTVYGVWK